MRPASQGFSLTEIVVVTAAISLLSVISLTAYVSYRKEVDFTSAQTELSQLVEIAKQQARTGAGDTSWSLKLETDRLTLFAGDNYEARDQSFDQVILLPAGTSFTGPNTLTFASVTGYPDASSTYTLQSDNGDVDITINAYGTITIQ